MPAQLPLGSELWVLFFDAEKNAYVPRCIGTISRIVGDRYFAGGRWTMAAYPEFGTEAEAVAWIEKNPYSAPTIK